MGKNVVLLYTSIIKRTDVHENHKMYTKADKIELKIEKDYILSG